MDAITSQAGDDQDLAHALIICDMTLDEAAALAKQQRSPLPDDVAAILDERAGDRLLLASMAEIDDWHQYSAHLPKGITGEQAVFEAIAAGQRLSLALAAVQDLAAADYRRQLARRLMSWAQQGRTAV